jgi:CHASE3 domain sensor protein
MDRILHKKLISISLLFSMVALAVCYAISCLQYNQLSKNYNSLIESYQTIRAANQTLISLNLAGLNVSSFLQTNDSQTLKNIPDYITAAEVNFQTLKQLVSDNTIQTNDIEKLTPLFNSKIAYLTEIVDKHNLGQIAQAKEIASDSNRLKLTHDIAELILDIKQEEVKQLDSENATLSAYQANSYKLFLLIGLITSFLFLIFFVLLNKYMKRY